MVGLPGQTIEHLVHDLRFFVTKDIDMLGMGPYIPHPNTPLYRQSTPDFDPFSMTLKIMALTRLMMPDINIVCSTALQTINPQGLELGLKAGANVVMPVLTPTATRGNYSLYANKKYTRPQELIERIRGYGYEVDLSTWGDSRHYTARQAQL
jgi:biotin synthase